MGRMNNRQLLSKAAAAAMQPEEGASSGAQAAPGHIFKNITLYTPVADTGGYFPRHLNCTKKQLINKLGTKRFDTLVQVDSQPAQILRLGNCLTDARDVEEIELADGMKLAVVVDGWEEPLDKLPARVPAVGILASKNAGWQRNQQVEANESKCAEWALEKLKKAGQAGAARFCYTRISAFVDGERVEVAVDGMAFSDSHVLLVELKPRITRPNVLELAAKADRLRLLVAAGAPNTAVLRDPSTGKVKHLRVVLMADAWAANPLEAAGCASLMRTMGIVPALPRGDTHELGDHCHPWPPQQTAQWLAEGLDQAGAQPAAVDAGG